MNIRKVPDHVPRSQLDPNGTTKVISSVLRSMNNLGYSSADMHYDDWVYSWFLANKNINSSNPTDYSNFARGAAAIDARDPLAIKYFALVWTPTKDEDPYRGSWSTVPMLVYINY